MKRSVLLSTFLFAAVLSPVLLQSNDCWIDHYPKLSKLELHVPDINGPDVISDFKPELLLVKVDLPADSPETAVLFAESEDPAATLEVFQDSQPIPVGSNGLAPLTLTLGQSELQVTVTSPPNGNGDLSRTYTVSIAVGALCDWTDCDDKNECTIDVCDELQSMCEHTPIADGTPCAESKGGCYGGACNFRPVSVSIGPKEVVFDWTTDRCEELDLPDSVAHVVRAADGGLVLVDGNAPRYYLNRGADFDTVVRDCSSPALVSADLPTPESYENWEWLWAPYREGETWHMLIHNEFHDTVTPTCDPGNPSPSNPCWYNSITYAVSADDGRSFVKPSPPAHVVAPPPNVWTPPLTTPVRQIYEGYFTPTNIVRGPDDYYYTFTYTSRDKLIDGGAFCLIRTDTLGDPTSWRAWDGVGFNLRMDSPYVTDEPVPFCTWVDTKVVSNNASLTYNTYLESYMLTVQTWYGAAVGRECGIYFSLSTDLIHWSERQLLTSIRTNCESYPSLPADLEPVWVIYPSIIDHADTTTNFERPGRTPHLYYTRLNGGLENPWDLDRDLVRVPLRFTLGGPLCDGVDCDDQNQCTQDLCDGADGSCEHTPIDCADSNDCTIDTCNPTIGCEYSNATNGTPCGGGVGACQDGNCAATFSCTEQGILDAIATGGGPHTFDCATPSTAVTTAEIIIDNDVILDGEGKLTVDGNGSHRVFYVAEGVTAELIGFTVTGGSTAAEGGGILNAGTFSLRGSTVSGNAARGSGGLRNLASGTMSIANSMISQNAATNFGGGMHNFGQAEIIDSTISGNTAGSGSAGLSNRPGAIATLIRTRVEGNQAMTAEAGGIGNFGTMTLDTSVVTGNGAATEGGGIVNGDTGVMSAVNSTISQNTAPLGGGGMNNVGQAELVDSTISDNVTANIGGGLSNDPGATASLTRSTVEGNNVTDGSGGGIGNNGTITLTDTTVSDNEAFWHGGGIFQNGSMRLTNTTVSGNTASFGGGLRNYGAGSLALANSTVSGNSATDAGGGGIANEGTLSLVSTTLAANSATHAGSAISDTGTVVLRSTLIAGDCEFAAPFDSLGGNIESEGNTCGLGHPTDQVSVPTPLLLLGPLQGNGGPTMTHALLPGSVAVDRIPEVDCVDADGTPLTIDQRGQPRPGGTMCDVGSFEVQP